MEEMAKRLLSVGISLFAMGVTLFVVVVAMGTSQTLPEFVSSSPWLMVALSVATISISVGLVMFLLAVTPSTQVPPPSPGPVHKIVPEDLFRSQEVAHEDMLLQSYRQMFLLGETFLVGVAALLLDNLPVVLSLTVVGGLWIVFWMVTTHFRKAAVDAWKREVRGDLIKHESDSARDMARAFLQLALPLTFIPLWLVVLLAAIGWIS